MPNDFPGFFAIPDERDRVDFATIIWNNDPAGLAAGFYDAASAVAKAALSYGINRNIAASPILFLARHWLELTLKSTLTLGVEYGHLDAPAYAPDHGLRPLWERVRDYVKGRWPEVELPGASWDEIEETIATLHTIDPKGMAFRFADERGALPEQWLRDFVPSGIDLGTVVEHLEALRRSLVGIYDGLCEEHAQEVEALAAYHEANGV